MYIVTKYQCYSIRNQWFQNIRLTRPPNRYVLQESHFVASAVQDRNALTALDKEEGGDSNIASINQEMSSTDDNDKVPLSASCFQRELRKKEEPCKRTLNQQVLHINIYKFRYKLTQLVNSFLDNIALQNKGSQNGKNVQVRTCYCRKILQLCIFAKHHVL